MHTIWVREHNRVESALHKINPHWSGERLFQEARRIVIAEIQHIVFNEHLPILLGPRIIKEYGLDLQDYGYYKGWYLSFVVIISMRTILRDYRLF